MVTSFFDTFLLPFAFRMKLQKVIHSKMHLIDANILCAGFLIGINMKSFQKFSPGPSFSWDGGRKQVEGNPGHGFPHIHHYPAGFL